MGDLLNLVAVPVRSVAFIYWWITWIFWGVFWLLLCYEIRLWIKL